MSSINNTLWVEKYRPDSLADYVGNEDIKASMAKYIADNDIPHLLFHARAGTGKTTLAKILAKEINCDQLYINASDENSVETIRTKIKTFASNVGFSDWKVIILDEADYLTPNAQAALRNVMETFSKHCRFILTCNYVEKIIDAIQSRCIAFNVMPPNKGDVARRMVSILDTEKVEYTKADIATLVNQAYPDIRAVINLLQSSTSNGTLAISTATKLESNWLSKVLDVLQSNVGPRDKFKNIRQIIADSKVRSFDDLYSYLFEHLEEFAPTKIAPATLIIGKYAYQDALVVDKEINAMALITELIMEL